jgi:hypothetical protein
MLRRRDDPDARANTRISRGDPRWDDDQNRSRWGIFRFAAVSGTV